MVGARGRGIEEPIVVRGKPSGPKHIELDEAVIGVQRAGEIVVRATLLDPGQRSQEIRELAATPIPSYQLPTWEEGERAFEAWVNGHDRSVPVPTPGSLRREAIYKDRV
jgi:hypothetical protein